MNPVWTRDGKAVVYNSFWSSNVGITIQRVGQSRGELLHAESSTTSPTSFSSDGGWLAYDKLAEDGLDIELVRLDEGLHVAFPETEANEREGRFSPVDSLIAFESDRTRRDEVWLRKFPFSDGDAALPVSRGPGTLPLWSHDGRTIYLHRGGELWAADVSVAAEISVGTPRKVLDLGNAVVVDAAPDGRFLGIVAPEYPSVRFVNLVLNWDRELEARVSGGR